MALLNTHTSKRILLALLLGCLLAVAPLAAQDRLFNRTDSLGRRSGLWTTMSQNTHNVTHQSYSAGMQEGLLVRFFASPVGLIPSGVEYFEGGKMRSAQYFNDDGSISAILYRISPCTDFATQAEALSSQHTENQSELLQAYCILFGEEGNIISEGWYIYPEDGSFEYGTPAGTHIFYNPDGSTFTRLY